MRIKKRNRHLDKQKSRWKIPFLFSWRSPFFLIVYFAQSILDARMASYKPYASSTQSRRPCREDFEAKLDTNVAHNDRPMGCLCEIVKEIKS